MNVYSQQQTFHKPGCTKLVISNINSYKHEWKWKEEKKNMLIQANPEIITFTFGELQWSSVTEITCCNQIRKEIKVQQGLAQFAAVAGNHNLPSVSYQPANPFAMEQLWLPFGRIKGFWTLMNSTVGFGGFVLSWHAYLGHIGDVNPPKVITLLKYSTY